MKRLAVFFDGTWNDPEDQTNVLRLRELVVEDARQEVLYVAGVGTRRFEKLRGGIGGLGLSKNVMDAYSWLSERYVPGDEIFVFGFSRGAFTARSLGGLLLGQGLLKKGATLTTEEVYRVYRAGDDTRAGRKPEIQELRSRLLGNARRITLRFIGIWDTVGTLGIPFGNIPGISRKRFRFHNTRPSRRIREGCQALAVDEHRKAYDAVLWTNFLARDPESERIADVERRAELEHSGIEQRWFVGAHSDVGGGYTDRRLALAPLAWIQERAHRAGLRFSELLEAKSGEHLSATPVDSYARFLKGAYRFFRLGVRHHRAVGRLLQRKTGKRPGWVETVNESIDPTVLERWRTDTTYRPASLVRFEERRGVRLRDEPMDQPLRIDSNWADLR